jgi:hypothetical protein
MQYSNEVIQKFIAAYERAHGETLTREEAIVMFGRLVRLYRVLLIPLPDDDDQSTGLLL